MWNGGSCYSNGNSLSNGGSFACTPPRSMAWVFRWHAPQCQGGRFR